MGRHHRPPSYCPTVIPAHPGEGRCALMPTSSGNRFAILKTSEESIICKHGLQCTDSRFDCLDSICYNVLVDLRLVGNFSNFHAGYAKCGPKYIVDSAVPLLISSAGEMGAYVIFGGEPKWRTMQLLRHPWMRQRSSS